MPECPNCHEYYFGTPDACPKCHKKIPSTENNTPSVKQHTKTKQYASGGLSDVSSVILSNIGRKIKTLAKVVCWIGIIGSAIAGIVMFATMGGAGVLSGILTIVLGALISWIGSFVLYGFGEMVENSDIRTELAVKAATEKKEE